MPDDQNRSCFNVYTVGLLLVGGGTSIISVFSSEFSASHIGFLIFVLPLVVFVCMPYWVMAWMRPRIPKTLHRAWMIGFTFVAIPGVVLHSLSYIGSHAEGKFQEFLSADSQEPTGLTVKVPGGGIDVDATVRRIATKYPVFALELRLQYDCLRDRVGLEAYGWLVLGQMCGLGCIGALLALWSLVGRRGRRHDNENEGGEHVGTA